MKKTLYLVRHGETLFNARHLIQGACDSPLTPKGIQQAQQVGQYFKEHKIEFDHAYSSTQERACDTMENITSMQYERLKGLKEWNFGDFEGEGEYLNPPMDPMRQSYGDYFLNYHGESDVQVQTRMFQTLEELMQQRDHHQVLVVSHDGAIYMFLKKWLDEHVVKQCKLTNCTILKITYQNQTFAFEECIKNPVS